MATTMLTVWPLGLAPSPLGADTLGISLSGLLSCTETRLSISLPLPRALAGWYPGDWKELGSNAGREAWMGDSTEGARGA